MKVMNTTLLSKIVWKMVNSQDDVATNILKCCSGLISGRDPCCYILIPILTFQCNATSVLLRDYWHQEGGWKMELLERFLPMSILQRLAEIQLPPAGQQTDTPKWMLTEHGRHTIRSVRQQM